MYHLFWLIAGTGGSVGWPLASEPQSTFSVFKKIVKVAKVLLL